MIDAVCTVCTPEWADAAVVWADCVREFFPEHGRRIVFATGELPRKQASLLDWLGAEVVPAEPPSSFGRWRSDRLFDRLCFFKLWLLGDESLGRHVVLTDTDILVRLAVAADDLAGPPDCLAAPPAWGVKPIRDLGQGPALSFGIVSYAPDANLRRGLEQHTSELPMARAGADQKLLGHYLWSVAGDYVRVMRPGFHVSTRAAEFLPDAWAKYSPLAPILHFGGPVKPWHSVVGPAYRQPYQIWRARANALGLGPYKELS